MALMGDPTEVDPEVITEQDTVFALEEDSDVAQENSEYASVANFVESQFQKAKDSRRSDEDRWLMAYRNYRGIYGPEVQFTDTEKSKKSLVLTTKCHAALSVLTSLKNSASMKPVFNLCRRSSNGHPVSQPLPLPLSRLKRPLR